MDYTPRVGKFNVLGHVGLDRSRTAVLLDHIESTALIGYEFIVVVLDDTSPEPVLFVASERNRMSLPGDGWSHFLGVFDDAGHHNLGALDRWAEPDEFFPAALEVACRWLGIEPGLRSSYAQGPG